MTSAPPAPELTNPPTPRRCQAKQEHARALLANYPQLQWLDPVTSAEAGFRNKAKLVVGGSAKNPTSASWITARVPPLILANAALYGADSGCYSGAA